jgi:hypothetical protein
MSHIRAPLRLIAHARSGDKGSSANIGVIAYTKPGFDFLMSDLTEDKIASLFFDYHPDFVKRYTLPHLLAVNFVLGGVLKGGAAAFLRVDSQGKTFGEAVLNMELMIPEELLFKGER